MTMGELILTAFIALLVFGPARLPTLARQLGKVIKLTNHYKQQMFLYLDTQHQEQQLQENLKKAAKADEHYDQ